MLLNDLPTPTPWHERLLAKIEVQPDGCWQWTASKRKDGYGQIWTPMVDGQRQLLSAHRAVYEVARGPIPESMDLDHTCHDPTECPGGPGCPHHRCVNPEHLEPATRRVNVLRGAGPAAINAKRTHCFEGHRLVLLKSGRRGCLVCRPSR